MNVTTISSTYIPFPNQKVTDAEKNKPEFYENSIDYVIQKGIACNDKSELEELMQMAKGEISQEHYRKTLNPYNSNKEKFLRFPATLRNLDITKDISRRYIGEYIKGEHEFIVTATNPEVTMMKEAAVREEITRLGMEQFVAELKKRIAEQEQQAAQQGQEAPQQTDPSELMPDLTTYMNDFSEKYIDNLTIQGQELIDVIDYLNDGETMYVKCFNDFVNYGECYSYRTVIGDDFIKEYIPAIEAYPVPNDGTFVCEYEMFARKMRMSLQQMQEFFGDDLDPQTIEYLQKFYSPLHSFGRNVTWEDFNRAYPQSCEKFRQEDIRLFQNQPIRMGDVNSDLFDVWHATWRGFSHVKIVTLVDELGMIREEVMPSETEFNPELGHLSERDEYIVVMNEGWRIGGREGGLYPRKSKAIPYSRDGENPYNGLTGLLPGLGKFSIIKEIAPFQILRNIISYNREMMIAKNRVLVTLLPKSLMGDDPDQTIYQMAASGILFIDDENDSNMQKSQAIKNIVGDVTGYIKELTDLMESLKNEAREIVDMTPQRWGDIATSAGKGTTQEAIVRGSMGTVIITFMFDKFRERDYQADLDHTKFCWYDGLNTTYTNREGQFRHFSLDNNVSSYADYAVRAKSSARITEELEMAKQYLFSAAQNGDTGMATSAVEARNIAQVRRIATKYDELRKQHELALKEADQMIAQAREQVELTKIQAKGEEDRKTLMLQAELENSGRFSEIELAKLASSDAKNAQAAELGSKQSAEDQKAQIKREEIQANTYNQAANRKVQREGIRADLKIANMRPKR